MFGLILVLFILLGAGIYYYLNVSGKITPAATTISPPVQSSESGRFKEPTITPSVDEELNNLKISTDDSDLQNLNINLQGL